MRKRAPLVVKWQERAEIYVANTLRLADRTVGDEEFLRIVMMVRRAFAPPSCAEVCKYKERCAGDGYCRQEIACNE